MLFANTKCSRINSSRNLNLTNRNHAMQTVATIHNCMRTKLGHFITNGRWGKKLKSEKLKEEKKNRGKLNKKRGKRP